MNTKTVRQFGTFEVENYGDRLFPFILEKELATRLPGLPLKLYSPICNHEISPILQLEGLSNSAHIIGGGDLISFKGAESITAYYKDNWNSTLSPHAACWILPILRKTPETPVMWNAPGVPYPFQPEEIPFVKRLLKHVDYLSVRDAHSLAYLREAGIDQPIEIVPDSVFMLPKHWSHEMLLPVAQALLAPLNLKPGGPLVFQINGGVGKSMLFSLVSLLKQLKRRLGRPILLVPIGLCHNDLIILKKLKIASHGEFHIISQKLESQSVAALIAHAGCFFGTSLHGTLTAFAYQVPCLAWNPFNLTKIKGFADLIGEPGRCITSLQEALPHASSLLQKPSLRKLNQLQLQVERHFDTMAKWICSTSCSPSTFKDVHFFEHHFEILQEMRRLQNNLHAIQQSKILKFTHFLKKKFPFNFFIDD